jgi:hypothetical protein
MRCDFTLSKYTYATYISASTYQKKGTRWKEMKIMWSVSTHMTCMIWSGIFAEEKTPGWRVAQCTSQWWWIQVWQKLKGSTTLQYEGLISLVVQPEGSMSIVASAHLYASKNSLRRSKPFKPCRTWQQNYAIVAMLACRENGAALYFRCFECTRSTVMLWTC